MINSFHYFSRVQSSSEIIISSRSALPFMEFIFNWRLLGPGCLINNMFKVAQRISKTENGCGLPSSNFDRDVCVRFRTGTFQNAMNPSLCHTSLG